MNRVASLLGAAALALLASAPAWAQALVKDGEEIADAKLMAAAKGEGRVNLYGTYPSENLEAVLEQFRKDTGLSLEYVRLPTSRMYDRVLAEFSAGKLEADYVDLTDLMLIKGWMERGILAAHKVPAFDKIQRELRDEQGRWYFIVRPISVISVNTEMLKPADYPKSWKDLLDPKYKGQIGMPHLDAGGSAVTLYAFWRMKVAEDSWTRLAANEPRIYATAAPVQNDLVRGRVSIGFTGAAGIVQQIENKAPLKIIFPEEGLSAFGAMGNVTTTAKHPNAAKVWVNYVTSKYGSTLMSKTGSYGTHMDSPPPQGAGYTFPTQDKVFNISIDEWEKITAKYPTEWREVFEKK
jgi:iron(III) transport system substrate-binding protein